MLIPALTAAILIGLAPPAPAAATTPVSEAQQIVTIARAQIGDPWKMGAVGPSSFDCSGLVIYAYRTAGDGAVIRDGKLRSAYQLLQSFRARGLASKSYPKLGDLVVWGGGSHIGICIGDGRAISTLSSGVRIHRVAAFSKPLTAYLHTGMSVKFDTPPVAPVVLEQHILIDAGAARP